MPNGDPDPVLARQVLAAVDLSVRSHPGGESLRVALERGGADDDQIAGAGGGVLLIEDLAELADVAAGAEHLRPVAKLELLRDLVHHQPDADDAHRVLAASLVDEGVPGLDDPAGELIEAVREHRDGDPLGRTAAELVDGPAADPLGGAVALVAGAQEEIWDVRCDTNVRLVQGQEAFEISSSLYSTSPLHSFVGVVDPLQWDDCATSHLFFRTVAPQGGLVVLASPDHGRRQRVIETVDFSLGLGLEGMVMTTTLDIVCWNNADLPDESHRCIGSTYALPPGQLPPGAPFTVDRGYVLAEQRPQGVVHVRTLKQVAFRDFPILEGLICPVWKFATGLVWATCRAGGGAPGGNQ